MWPAVTAIDSVCEMFSHIQFTNKNEPQKINLSAAVTSGFTSLFKT